MAFASTPRVEHVALPASEPEATPAARASTDPPRFFPATGTPPATPALPGNLLPISGYGPKPGTSDSPPLPQAPPPAMPESRPAPPASARPRPENGFSPALPSHGPILTPSPIAVPQPALQLPGQMLLNSVDPGIPNLIPAPPLTDAPLPERLGADHVRSRRLRWPGVVFPILFLLLSGIVIYLVLDLSGIFNTVKVPPPVPLTPETAPNRKTLPQALATTGNPGPAGPRSSRPSTRLHPISANIPPVERLDINVAGELPPTPVIDLGYDRAEPISAVPARFDPTSPSSVLEKFLNARSLDERLPILTQSSYSPEELGQSALGGPLPEIVNRRSVHYMEDRSERRKEHFFEVFFQIDPNERAVPILIQLNDWGDGTIRVHTDAFLDLFEDRLGQFAKGPVPGAQTFHVVADAYKHCFDEIIPDWEKKSFLKLRTHPRMAPRLIAHFSRTSSLADEISAPNALPWGESGICTVTVRWNTAVPDRPFVELIRINGFTWNP